MFIDVFINIFLLSLGYQPEDKVFIIYHLSLIFIYACDPKKSIVSYFLYLSHYINFT